MWEVLNLKPVLRPNKQIPAPNHTYGDAFLTNEGSPILLIVIPSCFHLFEIGADLLMIQLPKDPQLLKSLHMEADCF